MSTDVKLICSRDRFEFMVHWPSGKVEFVGFWGALKLCWWAVRNEKTVVIVDAEKESNDD